MILPQAGAGILPQAGAGTFPQAGAGTFPQAGAGILPRVALFILFGLAVACSSGGTHFDQEQEVQPAVVSEHYLATGVGLEILERGGNAADAAVATALALAVVYPQAGNLGGGGFALWVPAGGAPAALDFREAAPADTAPELYLDEAGEVVGARSIRGPLAVGVPGSPAGLHRLFQDHGSGELSWAELVEPAIELAEGGVEVDPWLARDLRGEAVRERMSVGANAVYYPEGRPLAEGERLVLPELAETLRRLASKGPEGFYHGEVAAALVAELELNPVPGAGLPTKGTVTRADLAAYEVKDREPLIGRFQGHELITMPPPSSGGVVLLQVLAVLEGMPVGAEHQAALEAGWANGLSGQMLHWWIEAMRRAFADRAEHLGDPDFGNVPVGELLSPDWITRRRISIGERADPEVRAWAPPPPPESSETTHLSVVDAEGNAVSMTTTVNGLFGSGILVRGGGFFLNNELDDFALAPGVPNQFGLLGQQANLIQPKKRPLSSMCPAVVRQQNGGVQLVLGSPGGPRIITSVIQVLLRVYLLDQGLRAAVYAPRLHQQWKPEMTRFERERGGGWDPALLEALEARGHPIELVDRSYGSVQAIQVLPDGRSIAVADPRRGGAAGVAGQGVGDPARP